MHVFYQKYCSYLCFSSIYGSPLFFLPHLCGVNGLIHPVISNFWSVRGLLKMVSLPAIVQDARGLLPGHFERKRQQSSVSPTWYSYWALKIWRVWSRVRYFDGVGGFLRRTEAIVPCWRCRRAGEAAGDLVVGGTQKEQRPGAAIRVLNSCFLPRERAPPPPHGRGLRCVPGSVSISLWRGVLKNRLHHPLLLVGGCPALHAFCGLTCLVPTPPVPCLSPPRPPSGAPGPPAAPCSPGLASTSLPFLPPARVHSICIPGSIRN